MSTFCKSSVPVQVILQFVQYHRLPEYHRISPSGGIKILVAPLNQVKVIFQDATGNLISSVFRLLLMISIGEFWSDVFGPSTGKEHAVSRQCSKMSLRIMTAQRKTGRRRLKKKHTHIYIYQTCPGLLIHTLGTAMTIVFQQLSIAFGGWMHACSPIHPQDL